MTLKELVEAIGAARGWRVERDGGGFVLEVPTEGGRRQKVALSQFSHESEAMVRISTRVGGAGGLDAARCRTALQLNGRFPAGCLAIEGDALVMTETGPLAGATPESSARIVKFLAVQADQYERHIYGADEH